MKSIPLKGLSLLVLAGLAPFAQAHTGHGSEGVAAGLLHPFALDHLLAMFSVGLWSACAFQGARMLYGPLVFMAALVLGAVLGVSGWGVQFQEQAISLSLVLFGGLLLGIRALPVSLGLVIAGAAGVLHGLAHGAEAPASSHFATYAGAFLLSTGLLHVLGLGVGRVLQVAAHNWAQRVLAVLGTLLGGVGLYLFAQI